MPERMQMSEAHSLALPHGSPKPFPPCERSGRWVAAMSTEPLMSMPPPPVVPPVVPPPQLLLFSHSGRPAVALHPKTAKQMHNDTALPIGAEDTSTGPRRGVIVFV